MVIICKILIFIYILGEGADPKLPRCKKKKLLRIEKKLAKNPNSVILTSDPQQKSLEDFISENDLASIDESKKLRVRWFGILFFYDSCKYPSIYYILSSFLIFYKIYAIWHSILHINYSIIITLILFLSKIFT